MAGQIRAIYSTEPPFPATDQHPSAVRYQVGSVWVDAVGGQPTQGEVDASLAPLPKPDFGSDIDDEASFRQAAISAVASLRQYLGLASPSAAQSAAALKLLIRVVFFLVRRSL